MVGFGSQVISTATGDGILTDFGECYELTSGGGSTRVCYSYSCDRESGGFDTFLDCECGYMSVNGIECQSCEFCNLEGDLEADCTNIEGVDAMPNTCTDSGYEGPFEFFGTW